MKIYGDIPCFLNDIFNLIIYLFSKTNAANLSNINLQLQVKNLKE
jgi:hypothetical protein